MMHREEAPYLQHIPNISEKCRHTLHFDGMLHELEVLRGLQRGIQGLILGVRAAADLPELRQVLDNSDQLFADVASPNLPGKTIRRSLLALGGSTLPLVSLRGKPGVEHQPAVSIRDRGVIHGVISLSGELENLRTLNDPELKRALKIKGDQYGCRDDAPAEQLETLLWETLRTVMARTGDLRFLRESLLTSLPDFPRYLDDALHRLACDTMQDGTEAVRGKDTEYKLLESDTPRGVLMLNMRVELAAMIEEAGRDRQTPEYVRLPLYHKLGYLGVDGARSTAIVLERVPEDFSDDQARASCIANIFPPQYGRSTWNDGAANRPEALQRIASTLKELAYYDSNDNPSWVRSEAVKAIAGLSPELRSWAEDLTARRAADRESDPNDRR